MVIAVADVPTVYSYSLLLRHIPTSCTSVSASGNVESVVHGGQKRAAQGDLRDTPEPVDSLSWNQCRSFGGFLASCSGVCAARTTMVSDGVDTVVRR